MSNKQDMAIVINGYDGCKDLWDHYFELLNTYWPDRSFPVYLVNNELRPEYDNVSILNCGPDADWSQKVKVALDRIDAQYICLLLEDFFTGSKIDNEEIVSIVRFIKEENIRYYKLKNLSKIKSSHYKGIQHLYTIPENMEYGISLQPAVWERNFLAKLVGSGNYNAWQFEFARIAEAKNGSKNAMEGCVYDNRNILKIVHGVVQKKYLPTAVKYFEKQNYHFDTSVRPIMSIKEYVQMRMKQMGKRIIPKLIRQFAKNGMRILGMKFVSDKRS